MLRSASVRSTQHFSPSNVSRLGELEALVQICADFLPLRRFNPDRMIFDCEVEAEILHKLDDYFGICNRLYFSDVKAFNRLLFLLSISERAIDHLCLKYDNSTRPTALKLHMSLARFVGN